MTLEKLEKLVSDKSHSNVKARNRKRHNAYAKKTFCKIARDLGFYWENIANYINIQHDNAMYHYKTFDNVYDKYKRIHNEIILDYDLDIKLVYVEEITKQMPPKPLDKDVIQESDIIKDIKTLLSNLDHNTLIDFRDYRVKPFVKLHAKKFDNSI
jgi:hypothetical protein